MLDKRTLKKIIYKARFYTSAFPVINFKHEVQVANKRAGIRNQRPYIIATSSGGLLPILSVDLLIGMSLLFKNKRVIFLLCDGALPACQICEQASISENELLTKGPQNWFCGDCFGKTNNLLNKLGFEIVTLNQLLRQTDELKPSVRNTLNARGGLLRYLGRGNTIPNNKTHQALGDLFKKAADISYSAACKALELLDPEKVILHHGIYVPQGPIMQACQDKNIPTVCWGVGYRKGSILLSHAGSYHDTLPKETWSTVSKYKFGVKELEDITSYLESREVGTNDWISFSKRDNKNKRINRVDLGINEEIPCFLLLTNVMWDAQVNFQNSIFENMLEWVFLTLDFFIKNKDMHLIVRIHPAEHNGTVPANQRVLKSILERYNNIPNNVTLVSPDNQLLNTYDLIDISNCALIYGSKAAIEVTARGKPTIITGDAWCKNKGFTFDPKTPSDYLELLANQSVLRPLSPAKKKRALQYAHYLFMRRMIPISSLTPLKRMSPFKISENLSSISDLKSDKNLNFITEQIIKNQPFELMDL